MSAALRCWPRVRRDSITRSPDHQITKSPNHQITKSPNHQITRFPDPYMPSYCGPPPPSGGTQSMIWYGSMMSQVLQCTQFEAWICSVRRPSLASTISYTLAGQNRVHGLPYSVRHRVWQIFVSCTIRCDGWSSE